MSLRTARFHLGVLLAYAITALIFSWPLPLHLGSALTGPPEGDTGVYVWNQWVFSHEILVHRKLPYFTSSIFSPGRDANLSLHNYTAFQNLLAMPLKPLFGVVATFNLVFLLMSVLTAYSTFLLVRHVTGRRAEAWLAGLLFAWSPLLVTRGMGHFSLVAAAPLAIFLLVLMKADGHERFRDAMALGAVVAWAACTDVYYGVYCLLIGAIFLGARVVAIHSSPLSGRATATRWALDVLLLCTTGLIVVIAVTGGRTLTVLGLAVPVHSLYTPMLVLTTLAVARITWRLRASVKPTARFDARRLAQLTAGVGLVAAVLLSPVLYAVGARLATLTYTAPQIDWRSGPGGVDVLALVTPNPNHPLAPQAIADWLISLKGNYVESVVSIPLVVLLTMAIAWRMGWRPSLWWSGLALAFGALALGPFVHVGGVNTYIPGPWALIRYVPILGLARMPTRFSVVMMLAAVVVFATALEWVGRRYPARRRQMLAVVAVLLVAELVPAPLTLHSAAVPRFYEQVAAAPEDVRVLELPTGISDGTGRVGNFSARYQFFQTAHGKPLIGGYLSRVSEDRVSTLRKIEVINALIVLSEGGTLPAAAEPHLIASGPSFIRDANLGFVIIDRQRASQSLIDFAVQALQLDEVGAEGALVLYRPRRGDESRRP